MRPVPTQAPTISFKRTPAKRLLLTLAAAVFVGGGLVSLALDDEPVAFALPEPSAPVTSPAAEEQDEPSGDEERDRAFALILAELTAR